MADNGQATLTPATRERIAPWAPDDLEAKAAAFVAAGGKPDDLYIVVRRCEPDGRKPQVGQRRDYINYDEDVIAPTLRPGRYVSELCALNKRGMVARRDWEVTPESGRADDPAPVPAPALSGPVVNPPSSPSAPPAAGADVMMRFILDRLAAAEDRQARLMERLMSQSSATADPVQQIVSLMGAAKQLRGLFGADSGGLDWKEALAGLGDVLRRPAAAPSLRVVSPAPSSPASSSPSSSSPSPSSPASLPAASTTPPVFDGVGMMLLAGAAAAKDDPDAAARYAEVIDDLLRANGVPTESVLSDAAPGALAESFIAQTPALAPIRAFVVEVETQWRQLYADEGSPDGVGPTAEPALANGGPSNPV